jgi:hypothetical protein
VFFTFFSFPLSFLSRFVVSRPFSSILFALIWAMTRVEPFRRRKSTSSLRARKSGDFLV